MQLQDNELQKQTHVHVQNTISELGKITTTKPPVLCSSTFSLEAAARCACRLHGDTNIGRPASGSRSIFRASLTGNCNQ